jgi:hypothetical protein
MNLSKLYEKRYFRVNYPGYIEMKAFDLWFQQASLSCFDVLDYLVFCSRRRLARTMRYRVPKN